MPAGKALRCRTLARSDEPCDRGSGPAATARSVLRLGLHSCQLRSRLRQLFCVRAGPPRTARAKSCPGCRTSSKVHTQKEFGKLMVLTKVATEVAKSSKEPPYIIFVTPCSPMKDLAIRSMGDLWGGGAASKSSSHGRPMQGPCQERIAVLQDPSKPSHCRSQQAGPALLAVHSLTYACNSAACATKEVRQVAACDDSHPPTTPRYESKQRATGVRTRVAVPRPSPATTPRCTGPFSHPPTRTVFCPAIAGPSAQSTVPARP